MNVCFILIIILNAIFFTTDTFLDDNENYQSVKRTIAEYNNNEQSKKKEKDKINLLRNPVFLNELEQLLNMLKSNMSKDLLNGTLQIVTCKHDLSELVEAGNETHASLFTSIALMLVSLYFFNGFTKKEIFTVISDVFSKAADQFPFPAGMTTNDEKQKYLLEKSLSNQLHGFANAWAHKNKSIADYWLYLEALLSYNRSNKKVKEIVSSVILLNETDTRDRRILQTLYDIFCSPFSGPELLNISNEKLNDLSILVKKGEIPKEIREFDYPFTQELVGQFEEKIDAINYKNAKDYYQSILTEAYGHRNFYVHRGVENEILKEKLIATLPNIVIRLRSAIFSGLKNCHENTPFDQFIDKLAEEGNVLLTN